MFRKRQPHKTNDAPAQQGAWGAAPGNPGVVAAPMYPPPPGSAHPAPVVPPMAPAPMIALLLLSADYRRAEELLRALEHNVGKGRYAVTWVGTIEDMLGALGQRRYNACLIDLASQQVARLEGNYQLLGSLPYLAVLTTPSLSDGDPLLQQLDARGYYAYIGYPFDGPAVDHVLTEIFYQMAQMAQAPQTPQGNEAYGSQPQAPQGSGAYGPAPAAPGPLPSAPQPTIGSPYQGAQPMYAGSGAPPYSPQPPTIPVPSPVQPAAAPQPALTTPLPPPMPTPPPSIPMAAPSSPIAMQPAPLPMSAPTPPLAPAPMASPSAELAPTIAIQPAQAPMAVPTMAPDIARPPSAPVTAAAPQVAPSAAVTPNNVMPFAIQPQLIRHRGLFVCWSPFDGAQRTAAALNLATALAFGGFRTLVGELRRPAGPLASYLQLSQDELSRSLFAASSASERLMKQKGYVIDQELLENHLLNAIPLDPHSDESPEVHFFLSGAAASPQLLFNAPALDSNQSPFVPEMLQMVRQYWDFAFIVVGSSPVDKLHWQAFRACDRLLVFLPPDAAYLSQAENLLPVVLRAAKISPANVDVILTQADRGLLSEQLDPILRFMAKHAQQDDHQMRPLRGVLARRQPQIEEKYLRLIERQLRKLSEDGTLRGRIEDDVRAMLKACGLEDKLAGILPDALPLMRSLRRQSRLLLPAIMQREFAGTPYALAIRDLLGAWVQIAGNASAIPEHHRAVR